MSDEILDEIKELLKYSEITVPIKDIVVIERSNYRKLWERVSSLLSELKK